MKLFLTDDAGSLVLGGGRGWRGRGRGPGARRQLERLRNWPGSDGKGRAIVVVENGEESCSSRLSLNIHCLIRLPCTSDRAAGGAKCWLVEWSCNKRLGCGPGIRTCQGTYAVEYSCISGWE